MRRRACQCMVQARVRRGVGEERETATWSEQPSAPIEGAGYGLSRMRNQNLP